MPQPVAAGLLDWKAFSSTGRPWHDPSSPRPEILLTDDPPRHTQVRKVIADALSPRALERVKAIFEQRAQELLDRLRAREGEAVAHRYARPGDTIRIDVLLLAPRRWPRHIVNAWQP